MSQFKTDTGRLPTASEGLSALINRPADVQNWPADGYLDVSELPKDAWGHEFVYVVDPNLPQGFAIYSCGRDGVTSSQGNDADDLSTWHTQEPRPACYEPHATRRAKVENIASITIVLLILAAVVLILIKGFRRNGRTA